MKTIHLFLKGLVMLFTLATNASGQQKNHPITTVDQNKIIAKAIDLLKVNYVFPEKIPAMEKQLEQKMKNGFYKDQSMLYGFIEKLNADLETLSNDKHVDLFFDPIMVKQIIREQNVRNDDPVSYAPEFLERARFENYMVKKAERLDGNIGYLKFNLFVDLALSKQTLMASMNFLSNSDALIIDLRQNGGGHAATCDFIINYFLPDNTVIGSFKSRKEIKTRITPGPDTTVHKFNNIPVYILVSKRTSSAAEALAYNLQAFKKAIIVGDSTKGEANPGQRHAVNDELWIMIPSLVNENAVTKTNWQGVGVIPDVLTGADNSLLMAQALACESLAAKTTNPELKKMYNWMHDGYAGAVKPQLYTTEDLRSFTGEYADNRKVVKENDILFYERTGMASKKKMIALTNDFFALEDIPYFRIRFVKNSTGVTTGLEGLYDDGKSELSVKLK